MFISVGILWGSLSSQFNLVNLPNGMKIFRWLFKFSWKNCATNYMTHLILVKTFFKNHHIILSPKQDYKTSLAYSLYWTAAAAFWSNSAEVWHSWASSARLLHEEELNSQWTMKVIVDAKEEASFAQCLEDTDDRLLLHILFTYLAREPVSHNRKDS